MRATGRWASLRTLVAVGFLAHLSGVEAVYFTAPLTAAVWPAAAGEHITWHYQAGDARVGDLLLQSADRENSVVLGKRVTLASDSFIFPTGIDLDSSTGTYYLELVSSANNSFVYSAVGPFTITSFSNTAHPNPAQTTTTTAARTTTTTTADHVTNPKASSSSSTASTRVTSSRTTVATTTPSTSSTSPSPTPSSSTSSSSTSASPTAPLSTDMTTVFSTADAVTVFSSTPNNGDTTIVVTATASLIPSSGTATLTSAAHRRLPAWSWVVPAAGMLGSVAWILL